MKITGYLLKEHIKRVEMVRDTTASFFDGSVFYFEGDQKGDTPPEVVDRYRRADLALAKLQTIQAEYNLSVKVQVGKETMSLCEAIKRVGGAGRIEKMWRSVAGGKQKDRFGGYREATISRDSSEIWAKRTISEADALAYASDASVHAGNLRAAIAVGNTQVMNMDVSLPDT